MTNYLEKLCGGMSIWNTKYVIEGWEAWVLYPNNNVVTWPFVAAIENQRHPTQKLPPM